METVLAAFATSAGSAAAATATSSLPWLVPAATSGSFALTGSGALASAVSALPSFGSVMSGFSLLGTVGGAFGQAQAGKLQDQQYRLQADQLVLNSRIEKVNAEKKANDLRRSLISNISTANAVFASRGIRIDSGTPDQARKEAARNASDSIEEAIFGGYIAANDDIQNANQARISGRSARVAGYGQAAQTLVNSKSIRSLLDL